MTDETSQVGWRFVHFGLVVTGDGERAAMPHFLRALTSEGHCTFRVIRQTGQVTQRSPARKARDISSGKLIPDRDANVALEIRRHVSRSEDNCAIWIDDLEDDRRANAKDELSRLLTAIDQIVGVNPGWRARCSAHFMVNMLEAYFFGDVETVNSVLGTALTDHVGDCENIRHPKNELKHAAKQLGVGRKFDEMTHGVEIAKKIDLAQVLSKPQCCRALRTLVTWCTQMIGEPTADRFQIPTGVFWDVTVDQLREKPASAHIGPLGDSQSYCAS